MSETSNLLVLPHIKIQHANCISSPLTWGFPAMSAFVGFMNALERRLPSHLSLEFDAVGVICHEHQLQTDKDYVHRFNLTRNPLDKSGKTAAIVEEGRIHLELTLLLSVNGDSTRGSNEELAEVASEVAELVAGMRIAGGSVLPLMQQAQLISLPEDDQEQTLLMRRLRYRWLPGFALVSRDDVLQSHFESLKADQPETTLLDAWLDLSRFNHQCVSSEAEGDTEFEWQVQTKPGWLVPIPVGYGALSELFDSADVLNTRDEETPFRFVESLYSIGQWISPHRINSIDELMWFDDSEPEQGIYRLKNDFAALTAAEFEKGIE